MISSQIGYAMALLKTSEALNVTAAVYAELPAVDELLALHSRYFSNPEISAKKKAALLTDLLDGKVEELTLQFLVLLAERHKLRVFRGICRNYLKLAAEVLGAVTVYLRTPFELRDETLDRLRGHLEDAGLYTLRENGTVQFDIMIDKSLLGGFVAETGKRMLDASLKTRLQKLARE